MKKIIAALCCMALLAGCGSQNDKNRFTVTGEVKNAPDQRVYLEEMYFSQQNPQVIDTTMLRNGKFTLSGTAPQQGVYRIRLNDTNTGFVFINDKPSINFSTDLNKIDIRSTEFNSPANLLLKRFVLSLDSQRTQLEAVTKKLSGLQAAKGSDSLVQAAQAEKQQIISRRNDYVLQFFDTTTNPVMALFTLGYTRQIDPAKLEKTMEGLTRRFPGYQPAAAMAADYRQRRQQQKAAEAAQQKELAEAKIQPGMMAPEITMPDTQGKAFSLSALKGKYVLVDFWASWCGPCRAENPNVVEAYNRFKNKNFTVLGVSLDKEKAPWLKAINDDGLAWPQVSDLKYWSSAAVGLYGFKSIPHNVLVDPAGKVIAIGLKGAALTAKLEEVLK